jgi:hypothetical protein
MTRRLARIRASGQVLFLVIIILALLGGGYWFLSSARRNTEKEAWAFARVVAERIALQHDERFVDLNLSSRAKIDFPPSWRSRLFENVRNLGTPDRTIGLTGEVKFSSYFFEPKGVFRAQLNYPGMPAYLDIAVSPSRGPWQIDSLNLTWHPAGN